MSFQENIIRRKVLKTGLWDLENVSNLTSVEAPYKVDVRLKMQDPREKVSQAASSFHIFCLGLRFKSKNLRKGGRKSREK